MATGNATCYKDQTSDTYTTPNATTKLYAWKNTDDPTQIIYTITPYITQEYSIYTKFYKADGTTRYIWEYVDGGSVTWANPRYIFVEGESS